MVDFLFVNPPSPDGHVYIRDLDRSGRRSRERTIWPQTSLAYLASVVKDRGSVRIVDCIAENMSWDKFGEILCNETPKYMLTNVISSIYRNDLKASELAKEAGAKTIAVGPHVTALPKETLREFPHLDFVIMGEAESTLKELMQSLENGNDLAGIAGLAYRENGRVRVNEKRQLEDNLDELPIPLHEMLPLDKYSLPFIGKRYTFVLASRGCPYECTFCRSPVMWGRKARTRSAEDIMKELKYLKKIGVKNFMFHSDTFTMFKDTVIELCKKMVEEDLNLRWMCNSRVDTIDQELLTWMKKAGCFMIAYGLESGSQKVLDRVRKGITLEQSKKAVEMTKKAGIRVWGYFIIGLPGETKETINETIAFSKSLPLDLANFAVASPYPGTDFYREAEEKGWLVTKDWEKFDQNYSPTASYPCLSSEDIMKGVKRAYKAWILRPNVILHTISMIRSFHDIKVLARVGFDHIKLIFS